MKVKLSPMFEELHGQMGGMVFREVNGETIVSRKPSFFGTPTLEQTAHRERFKLAAAYGKSVLADPVARELYEAVAASKKISTFALSVADYLNPPVIYEVDLSTFSGEVGQTIRVRAGDDFGVVKVNVTITNKVSSLLYEGDDAVETAPGSGIWLYTTTGSIPAGVTAKISVVATDRPGGTTLQEVTKAL